MIVFGASALSIAFPWAGRMAYAGSRSLIGALPPELLPWVSGFMNGGAGETVLAALSAALVAEVADTAFASFTYSLRGFGSWTVPARDSLPVIAASVPFYSPAVAVLVLAYTDISAWTLPLFFAPALAAQRWFFIYQEQQRLATDLQAANAQLRAANLSFAKGLIATLDARDQYTAGHSAAVAIYARDIAKRMELGTELGGSCTPVRSRPRHRQDRTAGGSTREARGADARRAPGDAASLGDWRTHPGERR